MSNKPAFIATAAALAVATVGLVLVLGYRSSENAVSRQLEQVTQRLQTVEQAQVQAAKTSQQASTARLGICWSSTIDNTTGDVAYVQVASPVVAGGVYQCPSGMNFVSAVPAAGS